MYKIENRVQVSCFVTSANKNDTWRCNGNQLACLTRDKLKQIVQKLPLSL